MDTQYRERPAIHVCLVEPVDPALYGRVEVGAEEESVPTARVEPAAADVVAAAYAAAQGSRFSIGVAVGRGRVVLHEAHMPAAQPVLSFALGADGADACRLMGANAARMVVRLPLRFADAAAPPAPPERAGGEEARADSAQVARIAGVVARILRERGIL